MPSQHTYCGRVWNLIQVWFVMYNLAIRKFTSPPPPSPDVENFQIKIYYPAGYRTPDLLNQRQTCYHLSQRGEPNVEVIPNEIFLVSKVFYTQEQGELHLTG